MNKPLKAGLVLGIIGVVAAGLISGTYLLTKDAVKENNEAKINNGLKNIFPTAQEFTKSSFTENNELKYCKYLYHATDNQQEVGDIYYCTGKNVYGTISLLVGIGVDSIVNRNIFVIENTESYASTLQDEYIDPFMKGDIYLTDVECGATYGATLIKDMITEAHLEYLGGNAHEQK